MSIGALWGAELLGDAFRGEWGTAMGAIFFFGICTVYTAEGFTAFGAEQS